MRRNSFIFGIAFFRINKSLFLSWGTFSYLELFPTMLTCPRKWLGGKCVWHIQENQFETQRRFFFLFGLYQWVGTPRQFTFVRFQLHFNLDCLWLSQRGGMCAITDMLHRSDTVSPSVSPWPLIRWNTIQGEVLSLVDKCVAFLLLI